MEVPKDIKWMIAKYLEYHDIINFIPEFQDNPELWKRLDRLSQKYSENHKTNFIICEAEHYYNEFYKLKNKECDKKILKRIAKKYNKFYILLKYETKYYHTNIIFNHINTLEDIEKATGYKLKPGNILGMAIQMSGLPFRLMFVGENYNLSFSAMFIRDIDSFPEALKNMVIKQRLSTSKLKRLYRFDFSIEKFKPKLYNELEALSYFSPKIPNISSDESYWDGCSSYSKTRRSLCKSDSSSSSSRRSHWNYSSSDSSGSDYRYKRSHKHHHKKSH